MNYEYIDGLAIELQIKRSVLDQVIEQPGMETQCIAVPPTDLNVAIAIESSDAQRLRSYNTANTSQSVNAVPALIVQITPRQRTS
jgi:hypothetical protein